MHNLVYLGQRRSQEFSCEPNFGGGGVPPPPGCATGLELFQGHTDVFSARCYASAVGLCQSVASRCSIETDERIELVYGA